jgi:hypothetical protein
MPTNTKSLNCERCDDLVSDVSKEAVSVLCWKCTIKLLSRNIDETIDRTTNTTELPESSEHD